MTRKTIFVACVSALALIAIVAFPRLTDAARGVAIPAGQSASSESDAASALAPATTRTLYLPLVMRNYPPPAPDLYPISNPDNDDYVVAWSSVSGATSYILQESADPGFSSSTAYGSSNTYYTFTFHPPGTWYYRVLANGAWGATPWSNVQAVTITAGPTAPVLYPINNPGGSGNYMVDWSDVGGATSYTLQEDEDPNFGNPAVRYSGSNSYVGIVGQPAGTWYYRVLASNAGGSSAWSNIQGVVVSSVLPAPTLNPIDNPSGGGNYTVTWSDVAGATSYVLQEDDDPYFGAPTEYDSSGNTFYGFVSHAVGTWYYRVRAYNASGSSGWSNVQAVTVYFSAPRRK